jgi:hypothetical protein
VGISNLEEGDAPRQLELFGQEGPLESERDRALSRVKDRVRERFGSDLLVPGRALESGHGEDPPTPEKDP